MNYQYLVTKFCKRGGYTDTSGYTHNPTKEYYNQSVFELDEENDLIKSIADFYFKYSDGEVSVYLICDIEEPWGIDEPDHGVSYRAKINSFYSSGKELCEKLKAEEIEKEKQNRILKRQKEEEALKAKELDQLAKLKAKYES